MSEAYRSRKAYLTNAHWEAISAIAAVSGDDSPDGCLERLLGPILSEQAALPWLIERRKAMRETLKVEYAHELAKRKVNEGEPNWPSPAALAKRDLRGQPEDQLP